MLKLLELGAVDLDPLAPDQGQTVGAGEDFLELTFGKALSVEDDVNRKIEQGVEPKSDSGLASDLNLDSWAARPPRLPPIRHADDDAARLEGGDVFQETIRVSGCPAQRMKNTSRVDELAEKRAPVAGLVHGSEQPKQGLLVPCPRVLL